MHILLTGGGSGGHITPLLAVAHELKKSHPDCTLSYVGERGGKFGRLLAESNMFENIAYIHAGKFRRYHDESLLQKIFDIKTNLLNLRDAFRTLIGIFQALFVLLRLKPDVVFVKGGFVGVPVGIVAALLRKPYITHDSDAVPGLANRIIARWARLHATGMSPELYAYPQDKTVFVGVPIAKGFVKATTPKIAAAKEALQIPQKAEVLFITGGSQGSQRINKAVRAIVSELLDQRRSLYVIHHVGSGNKRIYDNFRHGRLQFAEFYNNFAEISTAATVIVTRAGANSLAEFGALQKPTIVIPSPFLAGGHQLQNARHLVEKDAIIKVEEETITENPEELLASIVDLLNDEHRQKSLGSNLCKIIKPDAAKHLAELIVAQVNTSKR